LTRSRRRPVAAEPWHRPAPADRAFRSEAIDRRIRAAVARIGDPDLRRLLENTLPNTLDTTIVEGGTDEQPDTFVLTGDIEAMWLRDSAAQVWPYLSSVRDDPALDRLIRGVIRRQAEQVLLDPYANAFLPTNAPSEWAADETEMRPGVHERKWEPDSLMAFLRLSAGYWRASGMLRPFDDAWRTAVATAIGTLRTEQRLTGETPYRFRRPHGDPNDLVPRDGRGAPTRPNGMVHGAFRPSDDAMTLPLNVPVNLALAASLDAVGPLIDALGDAAAAADAARLAAEIRAGVAADAVVEVDGAAIWAYEVDGLGGRVLMDDANAPSLLSLPLFGACDPSSPTYLETRRWILSDANPWWFRGRAGEGIGSPHTGPRHAWPIAVAVRGLTGTTDAERMAAIRVLAATHAGTFLAHESFDVDDPGTFSRSWFAWANTLVGELLERAALDGLLA
jgi:meiotically up-regulated gene 157 (Mug157) protein